MYSVVVSIDFTHDNERGTPAYPGVLPLRHHPAAPHRAGPARKVKKIRLLVEEQFGARITVMLLIYPEVLYRQDMKTGE